MGANSYSCENSFGAINHRLWLKIALIWLFFIIILTFFIVTTHFRHQLHPKSCHTCILGGDVEPFGPSPSTHLIWRRGGPKYGYFWVKIGVAMAGWLPVEEPTWKLSYEPYHI